MKYCWMLVFVLTNSLAAVAFGSSRSNDVEFIRQATEAMNIFALPSFEMDATVQIDNGGKPLQGSYRLLWNGPEQWREELRFPGFDEVSVGGKGEVYRSRTTNFLPLRIYQLHSALGYGEESWTSLFQMAPLPTETIEKIRERKEHGLKIKCAEILNDMKHRREVCVNEDEGIIARRHPFVDSGLIHAGTKAFPQSLAYSEDKKSVAKVEISAITTPVQLAASVFEPPVGSAERAGCFDPIAPQRIHSVAPYYPERERQSHVQGSVSVYAVIGKDGIPRGLRVISGVTPGLNDSALDAIRQWGYKPATCNGVPIEYETIFTVNYSLR